MNSHLPADMSDDDFRSLVLGLRNVMEQQFMSLGGQLTSINGQLGRIEGELSEVRRKVDELDSRVERQDRRLAAIESFPPLPISQPSRIYATEAHSVSLPRRSRLGHIG